MSIREAIVSYRQIEEAVHTDREQTAASIGLEATTAAKDPTQEATFMAQLSEALQYLEEKETTPGVLSSPQHQLASALQSFLAERGVEAQKLEPLAVGLEVKFDNNDIIGWIGSFFTWWRRIRPHKFLKAAPQADAVGNKLRMALLGDWGTGLYGAPVCAESIQGDAKGYDLLFHLGDVYYSGTDREVQERFLDLWPSVPNALSRAMNSNHEMYSGGQAYFKKTLPRFGQPASYFALQNDHWLLVGLDTAYRDHDLHKDQIPWLRTLLSQAGGRKVVFFSHHQPFSLLDNQGPNLVSKLGEWLSTRGVFAWYWGHEHRCVLYDQHPTWGLHGRCVGHSGFPYFRENVPQAPAEDSFWRRLDSKNLVPGGRVLDGPNPFVTGQEERYGPHGYMTLEFDAERLNEIVHLPDGAIVYERPLT